MAIVLVLVTAISCETIHEFPDDNPVDPTLVNVDMKLAIMGVDFEPFGETKAGERLSKEDYDIRYIIEVYSESGTRAGEAPVQREVITKAVGETSALDVQFKLNARKYTFLLWADYVEKGTTKDLHYDTKSLLAVKIKRPYTGSHDIKDAFAGVTTIDLSPYREQWGIVINEKVELKRPLAKLEVVTTDIQKYVDSRRGVLLEDNMPTKVVFSYLPSIGEQYNVLTQKPERYSDSETFTAALTNFSATECTIAFDYVFVNGATTNVAVQFDIYDRRDVLLNTVKYLLPDFITFLCHHMAYNDNQHIRLL